MKKLLLGGVVLAALLAAVTFSQSRTAAVLKADKTGIDIDSEEKNPFTHLKLNADADQFQFAVISDRTGGHREKVFSRAMQQINLLQPEFVMSVGDLIEGYSLKEDVVTGQWREFDSYVNKLEMPFFYTPVNHDVTNKMQSKLWTERYGRQYFSFVYKNVLFLSMNSEGSVADAGAVGKEQIAWLGKTLAAHKDVRWTFVFLHKPVWTAKDLKANGWGEAETLLAGRKYTVFCGHMHRYVKFERNGANYYQLATTGGGSRVRGPAYGEFDQVAWVTMKKSTPIVSNILLDGVLPDDLKVPDSDEKGVVRKILPTHPASGRITIGGQPHVGATVALHRWDSVSDKWINTADGRTDDDGRFQITTYSRFDGAPVGEYAVTITKADAVFGAAATTTLRVPIREGENVMKLDLPK
jgi:3',5'-cyclic AMP phosphodiesterase CpdA